MRETQFRRVKRNKRQFERIKRNIRLKLEILRQIRKHPTDKPFMVIFLRWHFITVNLYDWMDTQIFPKGKKRLTDEEYFAWRKWDLEHKHK